MKDKDKVIERLTEEEQPKEVLGIEKEGKEYSWVRLVLDGKTICPNQQEIIWEVDPKAKKVMVYISTSRKGSEYGGKVTIKGKKEYIQNLLYNIGMGLPEQRRECILEKEEGDIRGESHGGV